MNKMTNPSASESQLNRTNPFADAGPGDDGYMQAGYVDPDRLEFTKGRLATINEIAPHRLDELDELDRKHAALFRDHGFLAPPDLAAKLRELITESAFYADTPSAS